MSKVLIPVVIALVFGGAASLYFVNQKSNRTNLEDKPVENEPSTIKSSFNNPKKAAHWESNTPEHGAVLAASPINIVINFNFDLAQSSEIQIKKGGLEYGLGQTTIDNNGLSMRKKMNSSAQDGLYTVNYKACWADGSCHDGSFQFSVDASKSEEFINMTNKKEVAIDLTNFTFSPKLIKVSKGTTITWTNKDTIDHTVNTDSHPAHTYFKDQNSRTLKNGNTYSVTFLEPGIYPYHCTPHADTMTGQILVVN